MELTTWKPEAASTCPRGLAACILVLAVNSCTGAIGDLSDPMTGNDRSPGGGPADPKSKGPVLPAADTRLRRLTRTEYLNTVRDLLYLKDTTQAANVLPAEGISEGFDNDAELLKADEVLMGNYDTAATLAVESAFAPGSASRSKLLTCDIAKGGKTCARPILATFLRRAWRRSVTDTEIDTLGAALDLAASQQDAPEEGLKLAFRMALVSARFIYRVELDAPDATGLRPVSPHALATRLSYFLWSSTPDDRLLDRADDGSLSKPEVFAAELDRMLKDRKADALVDNFGAQWLNARGLALAKPDTTLFRTFDEDVRSAMASESQLVFRAFLQGDASERGIADVLDAGFTFANAKLARHYRLPNFTDITGTTPQKVELSGAQRFGLLSQGSILTQTSLAVRTSPTRRGKFVLARLLCSPPPPPPAMVPTLESARTNLPPNPTLRDRLAAHLMNDRCAGCHAAIDPLGLAFEHYDAVGVWRETYTPKATAIDATGEWGGAKFDGASELSQLIKKDPRFVACFVKRTFSYALGREPTTDGDRAAVDALTAGFTERGARLKELLPLVANSDAFKLRGGTP